MSYDDWEVPEFTLPPILECNSIITLREQDCITSAANYAHRGLHRAANEYRERAGYGGCDDSDQSPFATL